jgi:hypothetical protein
MPEHFDEFPSIHEGQHSVIRDRIDELLKAIDIDPSSSWTIVTRSCPVQRNPA